MLILSFTLNQIPSEGFMTLATACHQGAIEMFWLNLCSCIALLPLFTVVYRFYDNIFYIFD